VENRHGVKELKKKKKAILQGWVFK